MKTDPIFSLIVIDSDKDRGQALVSALSRTEHLRAELLTELRPSPNLAVVLFIEPPSPEVIARAIETLGGANRSIALLAAVPPELVSDAALYLQMGVDDILWLPCSADEVVRQFRMWRALRKGQGEAERLRAELLARQGSTAIVGRSAAIQKLLRIVQRVAETESTVLILGETGTGKELVARALHRLSARRGAPFVSLNLAAVPEGLIENELFGHEAGAFTGATLGRPGRLEVVAGGTLFLDEVGDLPLSVQAKLLRVIQEREFERVGSTETRSADFRLVSATNQNLKTKIENGSFREDLYYRLNVVQIELPPLRERREDIPLLAQHFVDQSTRKSGKTFSLSESARRKLEAYDWPGNVRELEHSIERAIALSEDESSITIDLLPQGSHDDAKKTELIDAILSGKRSLDDVIADFERGLFEEILRREGLNLSSVARKLRLARQTLQSRLRKLGL